ncbi:hypothetical protein [Zooshikella ganghwensis]|uniref:hypothetical protein n=1 Tax=Zooshikella ganghwensis TaxID=202772 RepID=UPI001B7FE184|nr:hypothetical protein [Zooshikella ganghwensis]
MKKIFVGLLAALSLNSFAGSQEGTVGYLRVRASDGVIYFNLIGAPKINSPACATIPYWIIHDENSNIGKLQYSMVLAAKSSGKKLSITGMNTCQRWKDGEDVNEIALID